MGRVLGRGQGFAMAVAVALAVAGGMAPATGGAAGAAAPAASCATVHGPVGPAFADCANGTVFNILPAGSDGLVNAQEFAANELNGSIPPNQQDQRAMYANLVQVAPNLKASDITKYYKDAGFFANAAAATRVETPRAGTVILRDSFDVPHIYGVTRADTEYGAGYAAAEDRLFLMDVLRHVGRATLSSFIGPSPSDLAMDCSVAAAAGYNETEFQNQVQLIRDRYTKPFHADGSTATTEGEQIIQDGQGYVDGVNAYIQAALINPNLLPAEYPALQVVPAPWNVTDIVATATLVQAIFATGGGGEVQSALFYHSLVQKYGQAKGAAMWADFRSQNDPEAVTSIPTSFPYEQVPAKVDPNSVAMPTAPPTSNACNGGQIPTTTSTITVGGVSIDLTGLLNTGGLPHASNELIVDAKHSANGHPIAVFGPQVSYYSPEILHEEDLHGPGLNARGASFPGTDIFVELGRGADYAWSATSAGADIIDQRVEKLCNPATYPLGPVDPNSTSYVYNNACVPMYERTDMQVAKTSAGAENPPQVISIQIERTVHGPVAGRTTAIDPTTGQAIPVAISTERSTFGNELGSAAAFLEWNDPDIVHDAHSWQVAATQEEGTFNWTYVDSKDIAYYMTGKLPVRSATVNPNFPSWGTGQWDWTGFVPADLSSLDLHPRAINPSQGFFTNWNNKPAPGFSASDNQYSYGPVYRMQSLRDRVLAVINTRKAAPVDIINAMEDAGTVDLDGAQLIGPMSDVLAGTSLSAAESQALGLLTTWVKDPAWGSAVPGAHRRDRANTGSYEQGNAVALMDALYPHLTHTVFDPALPNGLYGQLAGINGINDLPRGQGSAYDGGWEGYVQRALKQAVGKARFRYSQSYCGMGSLAACQAAVRGALDAAISDLTNTYGSGDPATWTCTRAGAAGTNGQVPGQKCDPGQDDIHFNVVGLANMPNMPWVNRPTWQQVVNYVANRGGAGAAVVASPSPVCTRGCGTVQARQPAGATGTAAVAPSATDSTPLRAAASRSPLSWPLGAALVVAASAAAVIVEETRRRLKARRSR